MNKPKLVVGITQGDSNGIGYEVLIKSLADSRILDSFTPVVYGSSKIFGFYRKQLHEIEQMDTYVIHTAKDVHQKRINIVNCLPENFYAEPGQPSPDSAKAAMLSLSAAVKDLKDGYIDVLVTGPINKRAMTASNEQDHHLVRRNRCAGTGCTLDQTGIPHRQEALEFIFLPLLEEEDVQLLLHLLLALDGKELQLLAGSGGQAPQNGILLRFDLVHLQLERGNEVVEKGTRRNDKA